MKRLTTWMRIKMAIMFVWSLMYAYLYRVLKGPNRSKKKRNYVVVTDNRPLKIALITEYYYPHVGGITSHIDGFAEFLVNNGHDVKIITPYIGHISDNVPHKDRIIHIGKSIPIESNNSIARFSVGSSQVIKDIKGLLDREKFDVIHNHGMLYGSLYFFSHKYAQNEAVVGTLHTNFNFKSRLLTHYCKKLQRYFDDLDFVFAVSQSALDSMQRYFKCGAHKIIPNGINISRFQQARLKPKPKIFSPERFSILLMCRLEQRSGVLDGIEILNILRHEHGIDAEFVIIGEGPEKNKIISAIRAHRLDPYVKLAGTVLWDKEEYLVHADALLCTHKIASHSYVLSEFLASGKPVVSTKDVIEWAPDLDGTALLAFDKNSPKEAADKLAMIARQPELGQRLSKRGFEVANELSWSRIGSKIVSIYYDLLKPRN